MAKKVEHAGKRCLKDPGSGAIACTCEVMDWMWKDVPNQRGSKEREKHRLDRQ